MEPIATLTATAIAKLAFDEFVKSGAGELAKQSISGTVDLVKRLRDKIQARFKGNDRAEIALLEVEKQGTPMMLEKVARYLDIEMMEDETFANEVQQMAQKIINIQNQNISEHKYINYGRDQINIGTVHGDANIGGS